MSDPIAFKVPPPNHAEPDWTPAGPVMFNGVDATILADPGDEDRRPLIRDSLDLFVFVEFWRRVWDES